MVELLSGPWGPLLIFLFRIVDVSLGTLRMLLAVRGRRVLPPLIGFVEVSIWVLAAGSVVQNLASPLHVVGYAGGFAAGTAVGCGWRPGSPSASRRSRRSPGIPRSTWPLLCASSATG